MHRICPEHRRSLHIVAEDGVVWRFCLQCAKLHTIDEFSGDRRSCQASLLLRRQRKRDRQLAELEDHEEALRPSKHPSSHTAATTTSSGQASLQNSRRDERCSQGSGGSVPLQQQPSWPSLEQGQWPCGAAGQHQRQLSAPLAPSSSLLSAGSGSTGTGWQAVSPQHRMPCHGDGSQQLLAPTQPIIVLVQLAQPQAPTTASPQQARPAPLPSRDCTRHLLRQQCSLPTPDPRVPIPSLTEKALRLLDDMVVVEVRNGLASPVRLCVCSAPLRSCLCAPGASWCCVG